MNNITAAAIGSRIAARLDQIAHLSIRIQAAESVGLYAVAERMREKMNTLKAELEEIAPVLEGAAAQEDGRVN
jgi:hypothetical protein